MHNSSREQTSGMRSDDRGAFRDCPGGQDQRIGWEIDHVEAVGKRSEEGDGVSRDHHRLEEKVKWPSEVAPKQNGEKWRLSRWPEVIAHSPCRSDLVFRPFFGVQPESLCEDFWPPTYATEYSSRTQGDHQRRLLS